MDGFCEQKKTVIFLHIPKAAGTTLYDPLKQQYNKRRIMILHGIIEDKEKDFKNNYYSQKNKINLIKGHMTFGLHQFLDCPSTYITVLRNPVDRIISVYYYLKQSVNHVQHKLVKSVTLEDFVSSNTAHNNCQTRFIAGNFHDIAGQSDAEVLARAKKNLTEHFAVVGLSERFDETLILLKRQLGWETMPFYVKQNKSRKPAKATISQETLKIIQSKNSLDMKLYEHAEDIFAKQIADQDSSFATDLSFFKSLNKLYQPIGGIYSSSRLLTLKTMGRC